MSTLVERAAAGAVLVFDVGETPHLRCHPALMTWAQEHGIDTGNTYRLEVEVVDAPLIRVYEYARNEQGERYLRRCTGPCDYTTDHPPAACECDVARAEPRDLPLRTWPPDEIVTR